VGAIGISVPIFRFPDDLADKARLLVLAEARRVSRELGCRAAQSP
jgi:DNA-binding IclR family transcriptional regulator